MDNLKNDMEKTMKSKQNFTTQKLVKMTPSMAQHIEDSYEEYRKNVSDSVEGIPSMAEYLRLAILAGIKRLNK